MKPEMLCLVPLLWAAAAAADEAKAGAGSLTPLKLQVVFSRYQGEKKIGSLPYTLTHNANGELRRMRMGVDVPLKYEGPEAQGNVVFKSVGANVDCNVSSLDAGRFKVWCSLEQSSVHADGERRNLNDGPLSPPVLRSFRADTELLLRDGQTAQAIAAADPVTGETLKVDVTLNVVR